MSLSKSFQVWLNPPASVLKICALRLTAHEIARAVDPTAISYDHYLLTAMAKLLSEIYTSNTEWPCNDWDTRKKQVFNLPTELFSLPSGIAGLSKCLVDTIHFNEINHDTLTYASQRLAVQDIDLEASRRRFTFLTTTHTFIDGILIETKYYINSKTLAESLKAFLPVQVFERGFLDTLSDFVQEFECGLKDENETNENELFQAALEEAARLSQIYYCTMSSILNVISNTLIPYNLSKPANEAYADWISNRASCESSSGKLLLKNDGNSI